MKRGTFYAVGVGPGDPELMTLKAARVLRACPVIAAPRTKSGGMLALDIASQAVELEEKTVLPLYFTMERDPVRQRAAHEEAARQIGEHLEQGLDVAMLNLGDVSIYATCGYMVELLGKRGFQTVMVPGVPSFCAVAARLGESLTRMNEPVHIVPAGGGALEEALDLPGTKILMKSGRSVPEVRGALAQRGLLKKAALVQNCGLPDERVCTDLERMPQDTGYFVTIVVRG